MGFLLFHPFAFSSVFHLPPPPLSLSLSLLSLLLPLSLSLISLTLSRLTYLLSLRLLHLLYPTILLNFFYVNPKPSNSKPSLISRGIQVLEESRYRFSLSAPHSPLALALTTLRKLLRLVPWILQNILHKCVTFRFTEPTIDRNHTGHVTLYSHCALSRCSQATPDLKKKIFCSLLHLSHTKHGYFIKKINELFTNSLFHFKFPFIIFIEF